jgi:hypothetical protein
LPEVSAFVKLKADFLFYTTHPDFCNRVGFMIQLLHLEFNETFFWLLKFQLEIDNFSKYYTSPEQTIFALATAGQITQYDLFLYQRWASYANRSDFWLQFSVALALFSIYALTLRKWGAKEHCFLV